MRLVSLLFGVLAALALVAGISAIAAFLLWLGLLIWSGPDAQNAALRVGTLGERSEITEVCDAVLAGSNTIGEKLAPALVRDYLAEAKFTLAEPQEDKPGEMRLIGERGRQRCTVLIRSHGSGESFKELISGQTRIGMSSRPINASEIEALRQAGAGDFAGEAALAEHVFALDGIAIITHPRNPLASLSMADVKRIFLGQARDWAEFGAPPGPITLYARDDQSGTFQFFRDRVLTGDAAWEQAKATAQRYESSSHLVESVGNDPNAVGFVGVAYVTPSVKRMAISSGGPAFPPSSENVRAEIYPISRRLFLYVRPQTMRSSRFIAGLVRYMKSPAAFKRVEELGYVSLRPLERGGQGQKVVCEEGTAEAQVYRAATAGAQRLASVFRFLPNSNSLDSLARDDLQRAFPSLRDELGQGAQIRLIGHSDALGDAEVNRRLARERAESVRAEFEALGVLGLQVDSAGEKCPVADNAAEAGRLSNRRVEVWITPQSR